MNTELPELPDSYGDHCVTDSVRTMREPGYTADQLRAYGQQCAATRQTVEVPGVDTAIAESFRHALTFGDLTNITASHFAQAVMERATKSASLWCCAKGEAAGVLVCADCERESYPPTAFTRLMEYAGKTLKDVRNPGITAREAIAIANHIAATRPAEVGGDGMEVSDTAVLFAIDGFNEAAGTGELFLGSLRDKVRMKYALQDVLQYMQDQRQSAPGSEVQS